MQFRSWVPHSSSWPLFLDAEARARGAVNGLLPFLRPPRRRRGLFFKFFGAFLVPSRGKSHAFARRYLHPGAVDRPSEALPRLVEPHRDRKSTRLNSSP